MSDLPKTFSFWARRSAHAIHVAALGLVAYLVSVVALSAPMSITHYATALSVLAVDAAFLISLYRRGFSFFALPLFVVCASAAGYVVDVNGRALARGVEFNLGLAIVQCFVVIIITLVCVRWVSLRSHSLNQVDVVLFNSVG